MKNIVECIFNGEINENEREYIRTERDKEESEAYERLEETLTEEQKKMLDDLYIKFGGVIAQQEERHYSRGFKTGVWLGLELAAFEPNFRKNK
ncbi:MAG: hypothetical protein IKA20_04345 [Clostridia bacterium]|nr:hypothetical protein [Clostridia bacterium]